MIEENNGLLPEQPNEQDHFLNVEIPKIEIVSTRTELTFDKKPSEAVTLEELAQTIKTIRQGKVSKTRPIEHYEFIEEVMNRLRKHGLQFTIDPIWVSKAGSTLCGTKENPNPKPIFSNWILERMITKLNITNDEKPDHNGAVAIGYNEKGLQVSFGTNIKICSNMNIFGGNYMSTYGGKRMDNIDLFWDAFETWLREYDIRRAYDIYVLEEMKKRTLTLEHEVPEFIGSLYMAASLRTKGNKEFPAPLECSEITTLSNDLFQVIKDKEAKTISLYEVYQACTFLMKGDRGSVENVIPNIIDLGNFVIDKYKIDKRFPDEPLGQIL